MKGMPSARSLPREARESAQKIWLAGLGALAVAEETGGSLFDRLVDRGLELERRDLGAGGEDRPASEVREPEVAYGATAGSSAPPGPGMSALIDSLTPKSVPTPAMVLQARRNGAARAALMQEFGLLTSSELADLTESQAENRAALASRWKREGRIFAVKHHGQDYFPGFQLTAEGRPREAVARILAALGRARGWETALWFTAANGYLGGRRPVDLLESDPEPVVEAAAREGAETVF